MSDNADSGNRESEYQKRIAALEEALAPLEKDIRTLEGRVANRKPEILVSLKNENTAMRTRLARLEKALLALLLESLNPMNLEDARTSLDALRFSALDFCKLSNIDPDLWKNLEY